MLPNSRRDNRCQTPCHTEGWVHARVNFSYVLVREGGRGRERDRRAKPYHARACELTEHLGLAEPSR